MRGRDRARIAFEDDFLQQGAHLPDQRLHLLEVDGITAGALERDRLDAAEAGREGP